MGKWFGKETGKEGQSVLLAKANFAINGCIIIQWCMLDSFGFSNIAQVGTYFA